MEFGDRLKQLRIDKNMSREDLAKRLNISYSAVSKYETNVRFPDQEMLKEISEIFKTTTDYLMGNSDIRNPYNEDKEEYIVPEEFTDPIQAREYVNKHQIFGFSGFDSDKLDDEDIVRFANELLEQMKMVSYKYKKN